LSKQVFKANHWFLKESGGSKSIQNNNSQNAGTSEAYETARALFNSQNHSQIKPLSNPASTDSSEGLNKFFTPGWTGESLMCKDVKKFITVLDRVHEDVKQSFIKLSNLNSKMKNEIYDEFLSFAEFKALNCTDLDDYISFWSESKNPESKYRKDLDQFINIYSFRIAVVYILKIRFISVLKKQTHQEFDEKNVFFPNSCLTSTFMKGSSKELKTKALEQNLYSWYRASDYVTNELISLYDISSNLSITEITKNISIKSEKLLSQDTYYSHAVSHKNFGLFLNSLLINFPLWLNNFNKRFNNTFRLPSDGMEVISCKFDGDYLESLSLSHWLAQESNKNVKWDQILCPDFKRDQFESGLYMKMINELQFLTFLAQIGNGQGKDPIDFVVNVMNGHLHNRKNSSSSQKSLMFNDLSLNQSTYDRVIVNITEFPKSNVQHYIINQINNQSASLKDDGLIYVISSKRLFVPSQKSKLETLLKTYKLEGYIDLEDLKGKGEVGSYIYLFSKIKYKDLPNYNSTKQSCFNFRFSGNLTTFQEFNNLTKLLQDFFLGNLQDVPPMFHREFNGFHLEFFQDAIVDGRLIHSSSKDSSKITHPNFFNNLMNSCHAFDYFFSIENVDLNSQHNHNDPIFEYTGHDQGAHQAPYVAIVDSRSKNDVKIEIINYKSLEAKSYDYGHSMCSYFGITPKWDHMNLDAIRDYFRSTIGKQIIDLTFNGLNRKIKANLSKLLLPKFLIHGIDIPEHIDAGLKLLNFSHEQILELHPTQLERDFGNIERLLTELAKRYPTKTVGYLSTFRRNVQKCIDQIGSSQKKTALNFNNPMLRTPLLLSKTSPIYPNSDELFVEFNNTNSMKSLHTTLSKVKTITTQNGSDTSHGIQLYSHDTLVLTIYSDQDMVLFLEFIFENCLNAPISRVLQGVQVPSIEDLKNIISSFDAMKRTLSQISERLSPLFEQILIHSITAKSN